MPAVAHQHVGLSVADVERAASFYVEVFGADWLVKPVTMGPPDAAAFMNGPEGTSFRLAMVALPGGAFVELFEFEGEETPQWLRENSGQMPHMGIQVDDVEQALALAERGGGKRLWPEIMEYGAAQVMYMHDPDGNTIELIDVPTSTLIADVLANFPEGTP